MKKEEIENLLPSKKEKTSDKYRKRFVEYQREWERLGYKLYDTFIIDGTETRLTPFTICAKIAEEFGDKPNHVYSLTRAYWKPYTDKYRESCGR